MHVKLFLEKVTVKLLKIRTRQKITVIILKVDNMDFP